MIREFGKKGPMNTTNGIRFFHVMSFFSLATVLMNIKKLFTG